MGSPERSWRQPLEAIRKGMGEAERAVQTIESMALTLMVDVEERCDQTLSADD